MIRTKINILKELYDDEVIHFIANRYHTTPKEVIRQFLIDDGLISKSENFFANFHLEDNEIEIIRGLTHNILF